jgi:hypothetical protein
MRPGSDPAFSAPHRLTQCDISGAGPSRLFRAAAKIGFLWAFLALGGQALAQEPTSGGEAVGKALDALQLRAEPAPAADFVEKSRPDAGSLDYKPLAPVDKSSKKKSPAELDALGAELEKALARNRKAAARVKTPDVPAAAAAASPKKRSGAPAN